MTAPSAADRSADNVLPAEMSARPAPSGAGRVVGYVVAGLLTVAGAAYVGAVAFAGDGIHPNTSVKGVDISHLSEEQAITTINAGLAPQISAPIPLSWTGATGAIVPREAGLGIDAAATVQGHSGRLWNPVELISSLTTPTELAPVVTSDPAKLATAVDAVAIRIDKPAVEPTLVMDDLTPVLTPGVIGIEVNREKAAADIKAAFLTTTAPVPLELGSKPPLVSDADAADVVNTVAKPAVAGPITVNALATAGEGAADPAIAGKAEVEPQAISEALTFSVVDGELTPALDGKTLRKSIADQLVTIERPGKDATFKIVDGKPVVVPAVVGRGITANDLALAVMPALKQPVPREVSVRFGDIQPKLTTEAAKALNIKEKLSSFRQWFPYAPYRVTNVGTAGKYMNGKVIMPGETYSMNDTIKERTAANGYVKGIRIDQGRFVEDLGGGVSIITTATWTAAFFAGMERIEQRAHSVYIDRYQAGLEATVAWGNLDLRWRNNTPNGVLITTATENTGVTVTLWGTKAYTKITDTSSPRYDRTSPPSTPVYDSGPDCVKSDGVSGFSIKVTRNFYKGSEIVDRETFTTVYKPTTNVICRAAPQPNRPDPTPTPSKTPDPTPTKTSEPTKTPTKSPDVTPTKTP